MFKDLKLKKKILGSILLSAIVLALLVSAVVYFYLNSVLVNEKIKDTNRLSIEQVHESVQIFEKNQNFSKILSSSAAVKNYLLKPSEEKRLELLNILSDYAKEDNKYLSLYLLDKNGVALVSTDKSFVGQDYSFRDYYKEGIKGVPEVDLLLGKTSKQLGYYFSYPVFDDLSNILGVFVVKISGEEIDTSIVDSQAAQQGSLMLVDEYGIVIASNRPDRFLKSLGKLTPEESLTLKDSKKFLDKEISSLQYDPVQEFIRKETPVQGFKIDDKQDGETEIVNINKLGQYPFYLVTENGMETISATVLNILAILLALIILAIAINALMIYRLIIFSISPLWKLKSFATDISAGDFSKKIDIKSKDIFGDLATAFNSMADNLEKKFKEKTKKLEQSEAVSKKALVESEKLNKLMVGRELEMVKLKKEIIELRNNK
ncbi:MAG: cache domain-containing protein [Candidatus Falkowbacteria bacterium]|nr:cache domain-containing protein [Candidatus Falkowbacteria bacterium]